MRRGPAELAGKARLLVPRTGNLALQLLELGYPQAAILDGATAATGVRQASPAWLREPKPPPVDYDDGLLFRQVGAVPVASEGGALCVAYGDPVAASEATSHGLPQHKAFLAMPAQLARALALLPTEPTLAEAMPTDPTRRAAFAVRSAAPRGSIDDLEIDVGGDELDDALDAVAEATRTVPGSAPPMPAPDVRHPHAGEVAAVMAGARAGPASDEGASFEDLRTQQVDLVSPAGRAAVEPTVTATTPSLPPPSRSPSLAAKAQPAFRLPTSKATDDEDYEDVATVALTKGALEAMMAPAAAAAQAAPPAKAAAGKATPARPAAAEAASAGSALEDEAFNDPTEHVAVLASREQLMAAAKTTPKRPATAMPITDPTPAPPRNTTPPPRKATPLPRKPTPVPRATKEPPPSPRATKEPPAPARPAHEPALRRQPATEVELASTQPMPRHQPPTEMEVVPVPVARRGPSPLASALSTIGKPVAAEPASAREDPPADRRFAEESLREPTPARRPEPTPPPARRPSDFGARHIPGFDDAQPAPEAKKPIPGFDDAGDSPGPSVAPQRRGRVMMLHPPDDHPMRARSLPETGLQETEAEPPAPGPSALDPSALEPVNLEPEALYDAVEAPVPDETAPLEEMDDRERDFSRPPLPAPAPPPRVAPPLRFDQRPQARPPVVEEPDPRLSRRGGGAGGLQVLRAGSAPSPPTSLEVVGEAARAPAPPPFIPGIDSPMPTYGQEEAAPAAGGDRRSKQILIAAGVVAVLIIVGAGVMRVRSGRGGFGSLLPARPTASPMELPAVPPPLEPVVAPRVPAPPTVPDRIAAAPADAGVAAAAAPADGSGAAPAGGPGDGQAEGPAARQRELIEEARRLADPAGAIVLYSQAIEIEPKGTAARDALFERAKLYLATGDREHARADANKLKRREDTKDLAHDLQLILDGAGPPGGAP
ncbi:MAG: hypothetical protein HYS27_27995 [Deltaproteobacteria bacterium]|nr:hypothetical protein [Deltaproteobacteria bacterium]